MARFVRCTTKEQADALWEAGLAWFDYGDSEEHPDNYDLVEPDTTLRGAWDAPSMYSGLPASDWLYLLED